jgi:expansin (peptidoglycan-binding protein)
MRWWSLFLACQHVSPGMNLRECEDQSWFNVQAVPVFRFVAYTPRCLRVRLTTTITYIRVGSGYFLSEEGNMNIFNIASKEMM